MLVLILVVGGRVKNVFEDNLCYPLTLGNSLFFCTEIINYYYNLTHVVGIDYIS